MGPAWLVVKIIECSKVFEWTRVGPGGTLNDQGGMHVCFSLFPNIIAIDYTGSIVMDTHGFRPGFLTATPAGIQNTLLRGPQCFVHLDGHNAPGASLVCLVPSPPAIHTPRALNPCQLLRVSAPSTVRPADRSPFVQHLLRRRFGGEGFAVRRRHPVGQPIEERFRFHCSTASWAVKALRHGAIHVSASRL